MKRPQDSSPLSRHHHAELVQAKRLRHTAARGNEADRLAAAQAFVDFLARETTAHFREEEELLFPLVRRYADSPPALLAQVLSEHMQLHGFARRLEAALAAGIVDRDLLGEIGALLEAHIRLEERELFRLIQELVPSDELEALPLGGGACPFRG